MLSCNCNINISKSLLGSYWSIGHLLIHEGGIRSEVLSRDMKFRLRSGMGMTLYVYKIKLCYSMQPCITLLSYSFVAVMHSFIHSFIYRLVGEDKHKKRSGLHRHNRRLHKKNNIAYWKRQ